MVSLSREVLQRAGINVEDLIARLDSIAAAEQYASNIYSTAFTAVRESALSEMVLRARRDHSRHFEKLLLLIKQLGGIYGGITQKDIQVYVESSRGQKSSSDERTIAYLVAPARVHNQPEAFLAQEEALIKLYDRLLESSVGKLSVMDDLIASFVKDANANKLSFAKIAQEYQQSESLQGLRKEQERILAVLEKQIISISHLERLSTDLHAYLVALSLGLATDELKIPRFIPVRVYISRYEETAVERISNAALRFAEVMGFGVSVEGRAEGGSWFKGWVARSKDFLTKPEVTERLKKGERAVELATLATYQANVDKTQAEAAAILVQSLQQTEEAVVQIGSLIIVKVSDPVPRVVARSLSQRDLAILEENPSLLRNAGALLHSLQGGQSDPAEEAKLNLLSSQSQQSDDLDEG